jgi:hypothetical protein
MSSSKKDWQLVRNTTLNHHANIFGGRMNIII